jgi:hypothetical protein
VSRIAKLLIALFVLACCLIFAGALAGGLMDDTAFTQQAKDAAH